MPGDIKYMVLFSANLAFIVTHLYGWLLKRFFRPKAYREHFHDLFPAQRAVSVIYLLQLLELPYLLHIGDPDALLYVNAFSLLFFSIQMYVMCDGYFFIHRRRRWVERWIFLPAVVLLLPLLLQALRLVSLPEGWRRWVVGAVSVLFVFYFWRNIRMALRIERAVRRVNEDRYADSDDFPVRFANIIKWVPTLILVLLAINFYVGDVWVKFVRDLLFIGAGVWFCLITLNPWRKDAGMETALAADAGVSEEQETPGCVPAEGNRVPAEGNCNTAHLLSDARCDELARRLECLLTEEHIFTEPHITIDTLIAHLGTNSKYLAEVIRRSGYQSFYDMICQHRVRYAISLIHQHPEERLSDISDRCGFSSPASMSKAFKAQGKEPPSRYRGRY